MNKKIIALAVAASFAAAPLAAQAEVTVYGAAQVEVASWGDNAGKGVSVEDVARGRFGIKASEDLGGGLKGIMKFEFKVDTADGTAGSTLTDSNGDTVSSDAAVTKRENMVGLKGGWGEIQAGRLKSAYKYLGGVKYDAFTTTVLESRGNGGMSGKVGAGNGYGHNGFISDSVGYKGKFGNIVVWVTHDFDNGGGDGGVDTGGTGSTYGAKYGSKMWEAGFAGNTDDETGNAEYSAIKAFGSVKFAGAHTLRAQYESIDQANTVNDAEYIYVNYGFKFSKNLLDVAYGTLDVDGGSTADEDFLRIALKHKFSKKTSTWIGYRSTDRDGSANDVSVVSIGLRKDF